MDTETGRLSALLAAAYGIKVADIHEQAGGWSARAFCVTDRLGKRYFLKFYEKRRPSVLKWASYLSFYIPFLRRACAHPALRGHLPVPVPVCSGADAFEDREGIYLLYEYLPGETIGGRSLRPVEWEALADGVAALHGNALRLAAQACAVPQETFDVPFAEHLCRLIGEGALPAQVLSLLAPYREPLLHLIARTEAEAGDLQKQPPRMVACHMDLHNWNLMVSAEAGLTILDWEGVRIAPPEADLMFLFGKPYAEAFFERYAAARLREDGTVFSLNLQALQFYFDRRRIEDIHDFVEQLCLDRQSAEETEETLSALRKELAGAARQIETSAAENGLVF